MTLQAIFLLAGLVSCVSAQFVGAELSSDSSNPLDELSDTQFIVRSPASNMALTTTPLLA